MATKENNPPFKLGEKVKCLVPFGNKRIINKIGTVVYNDTILNATYIDFGEYINGGDAGGHGTMGNCWGFYNDRTSECLVKAESYVVDLL